MLKFIMIFLKNMMMNLKIKNQQSWFLFVFSNKCKDKNEFDKEAKVVETINKTMEDKIFPNYDYEADLKELSSDIDLYNRQNSLEENDHKNALFQALMVWAGKPKDNLIDLYIRFGPMDDQSGKAFSSDVNDMIKTSSLYKYENVENPNRFFLIRDEQKAEFERNHHVIYADKQDAGYLDYIFDFIEKCLTMSPEEAAQSMVNEYNNNDGQSRTRNDQ